MDEIVFNFPFVAKLPCPCCDKSLFFYKRKQLLAMCENTTFFIAVIEKLLRKCRRCTLQVWSRDSISWFFRPKARQKLNEIAKNLCKNFLLHVKDRSLFRNEEIVQPYNESWQYNQDTKEQEVSHCTDIAYTVKNWL